MNDSFLHPLETKWHSCVKTQIDSSRNDKHEWNVLSTQNKTANKSGMRFRFKTKWQTSHEIAFDSKQNENQVLNSFSTRVENEFDS